VPAGLALRLGHDGARELNDLLDSEEQNWSERVLTLTGERFERRLIDEAGKLRLEIATLGADLRQEFAKDRFELLKWMFVFWIGQIAAMSAIMSFLLRR